MVINIHFYESKVMEIVRLAHLLANKKFIISERGQDREMEHPFEEGIAFSDYDLLPEACLHYIEQPKKREKIASRGHEIFRKYCQVEFLKRAVERQNSSLQI